eukprot:TRINITY_DN757_c0_g1_i1.p3 TRINITY_DN757_c0_g1~~TRINITY_DN757_c0_g1_i1.p3  ORF type:complete len:138 (-),score=35.70 TRINITY_DN757_c0_g1_i1:528-941(-)
MRRPPRSTLSSSSAASDVYKRQVHGLLLYLNISFCIPTTFSPFNTTISGKAFSGGILYTPPPKSGNYFSIQIPEGKCSDRATTLKTAKYHDCKFATNAGLFDMLDGACIGNVVVDGEIIQQQDTLKVNFGVQKNGSL